MATQTGRANVNEATQAASTKGTFKGKFGASLGNRIPESKAGVISTNYTPGKSL